MLGGERLHEGVKVRLVVQGWRVRGDRRAERSLWYSRRRNVDVPGRSLGERCCCKGLDQSAERGGRGSVIVGSRTMVSSV